MRICGSLEVGRRTRTTRRRPCPRRRPAGGARGIPATGSRPLEREVAPEPSAVSTASAGRSIRERARLDHLGERGRDPVEVLAAGEFRKPATRSFAGTRGRRRVRRAPDPQCEEDEAMAGAVAAAAAGESDAGRPQRLRPGDSGGSWGHCGRADGFGSSRGFYVRLGSPRPGGPAPRSDSRTAARSRCSRRAVLLPERASDEPDVAIEVRLVHDGVGRQSRQQLLLGNQVSASRTRRTSVRSLGLEGDETVDRPDDVLRHDETEITDS